MLTDEQISNASVEELRLLNSRIIAAIKFKNELNSINAKQSIHVGQIIKLKTSNSRLINKELEVLKINKKYVVCMLLSDRSKWNILPCNITINKTK